MRRKTLQQGLVGVLVFAAVLLVVEGVARLAEPTLPGWRRADATGVMMTGHPTRLWGLTEGQRDNFGASATINERGLRGPLPEVPRPEGRLRLMITGDSSFFGHGVDDGQDMGSVAVSLLPDADLVNAAVPGYSLLQTRVLLEEEGWAYEPSVLVIGNLWSDNTFDHFPDEDLLRSTRFAQNNPLSHSAALRLLASAVGDSTGSRIITVSKLEPFPEGTVRRVPVQRYAELLDQTVREAGERGVGAVLVKPANRTSLVESGHWQPYYDAMDAVGAHHGLPVIDTNDLFRGLDPDELFLDLMHPTVQGHALMGQAIAQAVAEGPVLATNGPLEQTFQDIAPSHNESSPMISPQDALFEGSTMTTAPEDPAAWRAQGVVAGAGPFTVSVLVQDKVVSSVNLPNGGEFNLGVRVSVDEAVVRVQGKSIREFPVTPSSGPLQIEMD